MMLDNNLFTAHFARITTIASNAKMAFLDADSKFVRSEQVIPCHGFMLLGDITTMGRISLLTCSCIIYRQPSGLENINILIPG